jgi:hypothetical protein
MKIDVCNIECRPCPYIDLVDRDGEIRSCDDAESYCSGNVAASVYCGQDFGLEGQQLDFHEAEIRGVSE